MEGDAADGHTRHRDHYCLPHATLVGVWVVLRRVAFLGDALGHGIVPGVAVATLIGVAAPIGAAVAAAVMVAGISIVSRQRRLGEDTGIGLLFVGMLALGVIIISRSDSFAVDVSALLFGAVLGVSAADLWLAAGATRAPGAGCRVPGAGCRVPAMMAVATVGAWTAVVGGLLISYHASIAAGGAIALMAIAQFFVVATGRSVIRSARLG